MIECERVHPCIAWAHLLIGQWVPFILGTLVCGAWQAWPLTVTLYVGLMDFTCFFVQSNERDSYPKETHYQTQKKKRGSLGRQSSFVFFHFHFCPPPPPPVHFNSTPSFQHSIQKTRQKHKHKQNFKSTKAPSFSTSFFHWVSISKINFNFKNIYSIFLYINFN